MVRQVKLIVEQHADGFVAYPLGTKGVIVGQGDTYEEAVADVESAIAFHIETFGADDLESDTPVIEAFVTETGVTGRKAEESLNAAGIVVNRNTIPFDHRPPAVTSGIRLGTPAATTRGFGKEEMKQIASLIARIISNIDDKDAQQQVNQEVNQICLRFPVPGIDV